MIEEHNRRHVPAWGARQLELGDSVPFAFPTPPVHFPLTSSGVAPDNADHAAEQSPGMGAVAANTRKKSKRARRAEQSAADGESAMAGRDVTPLSHKRV